MVPPGTHLVAYNSASGQGDFGPTTCFFATLKGGQVGIFKSLVAVTELQKNGAATRIRLL